MALVLRLNRGATYGTINLNDLTNYKVMDTFLPRVATRRVSAFGGEPYNEVVEQIPLYIFGSTAAAVLEKLEDLIVALEQAHAWRLGAVVDPVLLEYLPHGTSLGAVVQAAVLGTPADAANLFEMAQFGMYMTGNSFETMITLPVIRRGLWLGAAETPSATSEIDNPGAMSVTFANNLRLPSPVKLVFAAPTELASLTGGTYQGYLFVADQADKIILTEAEGMTTDGSGWSDVSDTEASGGSKKRLTPGSASQVSLTKTSLGLESTSRLFAVYANLTNLSNAVRYTLQVSMRPDGGTSDDDRAGRPVEIPASFGKQMVFLGLLALSSAATQVKLAITPSAGSGAGHELDLDYLVVLAVDEFTKAVAFFETASLEALTLDHRALVAASPAMTKTFGGGAPTAISRSGDLYLNSVGTNLTARLCGTTLTGSSRHTLTDESGTPAIVGFTLTATRLTAYLSVR